MRFDPKALKPGDKVLYVDGSITVLKERKADDTGWWVEGGGGLADKVLTGEWDPRGDWTVLAWLIAVDVRGLTVSGKKPLCPWCRHRHTPGEAVCYFDDVDDLYRCARCDHPIDEDGECRTERCCGYVPDSDSS